MNKRVFVFLLFLVSALHGYSQVSWNVKAGMNFSRITDLGDVDLKPGYQFGVGLDYYFNDHWGIRPSLMLISKGYKDKGNYYYPAEWDKEKLKSYDITENRIYIEVPVMLAYRFPISNALRLVLDGGGYIGYGIGGKFKNINTLEDDTQIKNKSNAFSDGMEKFDTGIAAGFTLEYKSRYTIGLVGEWGLKSIVKDSKNQTYGLNIGYKS